MTIASFDTLKYANTLKAAGELKQAIDLLRADMNANFTLLKWMVGALIPLVIGVLVRLLFFRIP